MNTLIAATGEAELRVDPDRATLFVGVRTEDPSSMAAAARHNAPIHRTVVAALQDAGIPAERLATLRYNTGRQSWYDSERHTPVYGDYYVEHVMSVEIHDLAAIGGLITTARNAGATRIVGIRFWLSDEEVHHERAMRQAVAQAFSRARTLAEAAGATLGRVARLGTPEALAAALGAADLGGGGMRVVAEAAAAPPTGEGDEEELEEDPVILPVPITVSVTVHGAWEVELPG